MGGELFDHAPILEELAQASIESRRISVNSSRNSTHDAPVFGNVPGSLVAPQSRPSPTGTSGRCPSGGIQAHASSDVRCACASPPSGAALNAPCA